MPVLRRCGTCIHHVSGSNTSSGQCGHPARQNGGGVAVLVRSAELACRTSWGSDLWEPQPGDFSIDVKIWGPFAPDMVLDEYPGDLLTLLLEEDSDGLRHL